MKKKVSASICYLSLQSAASVGRNSMAPARYIVVAVSGEIRPMSQVSGRR